MLPVFPKVAEHEPRTEGITYDDSVLWNILVCGLCDDCYTVNPIHKNSPSYTKDRHLQIKISIETITYVEVSRSLYIMFFIFFFFWMIDISR